jgi:hypothetical protein
MLDAWIPDVNNIAWCILEFAKMVLKLENTLKELIK